MLFKNKFCALFVILNLIQDLILVKTDAEINSA